MSQKTIGNKGLARELGYPECNGYLQRQIGPTQFGSSIENDDATHTSQTEGRKRFITYVTEVSGRDQGRSLKLVQNGLIE